MQSQQGEWGKGPGSTVGMTLAHQVLGLLFRHHWSWSHLHSDPLGRRECGQGTCRRLSTVWFLWPAGRSCQSSLQGVGLFFSALHFCISCRGLGELWLQPKCPSLLLSLLQLSCDCRRRRWAAGVAAQALCWSQGWRLRRSLGGRGNWSRDKLSLPSPCLLTSASRDPRQKATLCLPALSHLLGSLLLGPLQCVSPSSL